MIPPKLTVCEVCRKRVPISKVVKVSDKFNLLFGLVVCQDHVDKRRNYYADLKDVIKKRIFVDYERAREEPTNVYVVPTLSGDAPSAPRNLRESGRSSTSLTLFWDPPRITGSGSINGYKVEYQVNGSGYTTLIANTDSIATQYTLTISENVYYDFRVYAINAFGTSPVSNTYSFETLSDDAVILTDESGNLLIGDDGSLLLVG